MRIAVVGTGIAGMVAAHVLSPENEVVVFEAGDYIGGHTNTVTVNGTRDPVAIDTGFIVFNHRTYPNFTRLMDRLDVPTQPTDMSFSVSCRSTGFEYAGAALTKFFAQRRNLFRPPVWRIIFDCLRFNRECPQLLNGDAAYTPLARYVETSGYSRDFLERFLIPMGAAIWSSSPQTMREFPVGFFARFFQKHGMLGRTGRPVWHTISGGSQRYVEKLTAGYRDRVHLHAPIERILRRATHVELTPHGAPTQRFDHVIIATHSDQALRMLGDPSPLEQEILGAIPYQANRAVLHTDTSVLPRQRRAWASWNYHLSAEGNGHPSLTYDMNSLQRLDTTERFCVSLNSDLPIDPAKRIVRITYHHPLFTATGVAAQRRHDEISGRNRTHYCGAYWGYGFHEDGVNSALAVARRFGRSL
jgi:predicted NAD/FAD-binding protein